MKRLAIAVLASALAGSILASLTAPRVLVWYFTPPAGMAMTFNAASAVQWGMDRLLAAQLYGAAGGAILALIVALLFVRRKRASAAVTAQPAAPQK